MTWKIWASKTRHRISTFELTFIQASSPGLFIHLKAAMVNSQPRGGINVLRFFSASMKKNTNDSELKGGEIFKFLRQFVVSQLRDTERNRLLC